MTKVSANAAALSVPLNLSRRQLVFGGVMLATSVTAIALTPRASETALPEGALERSIPKQLGPWRLQSTGGLVLPPRDSAEKLIYDQVLTRSYAHPDGGPNVMLLIAYGGGQTGVLTVHRPEACYPAQGYTLSGRQAVQVPVGPGREATGVFWSAKSVLRDEQLLYWTRIDKYFPNNWATEQVAIIRTNLARRLPDGVLVRMSVSSSDAAPSIQRLEMFARDLVKFVGPSARRIMLG